MCRSAFALSLCGLVLWGLPASLQAYPWRMHKVQIIYSIKYDDDVQVRTMGPPPSAVRDGLTPKELRTLRDRSLPGYQAKLSDISGAWYVTIYTERVVAGGNGAVRRVSLPPAFCMVHHNYTDRKYLCLFQQQLALGNPPPPYLIGNPGGGGIPLPGVRLKMIVIHSYYPLPGAGGGLIR